MFYHNNGKLRVSAETRCGSTSMEYYFNQGRDPDATTLDFGLDLIVVLRNPLDRMASAVKGIQTKFIWDMPMLNTPYYKEILKKNGRARFKEYVIFQLHCSPFLDRYSNKEFRIIDFYKLKDYIPVSPFGSPITNSSGYTDPKEVYVRNRYFTLEDLEQEYAAYQVLLNIKEQISIEEWKEKTP